MRRSERVHLEYPLRLCERLRSTNLLERSLEEVERRTKVIGRSPARRVLDLFIASARGLALTALEHRRLAFRRRPDATPCSPDRC